jgi:cell division transport system permease protein
MENMKLSSFRYVFPQALKSLKINGWMTMAAVFNIAISVFLCLLFLAVIINSNANAGLIESNVEIIGFIKDDYPAENYRAIEESLYALEGFAEMKFISREEGLGKIAGRFGGDTESLLETLGGENPLPDSYSVKALTPEHVEALAQGISAVEGIESVRYGQDTVDKLFLFTKIIRQAGLGIMLLLVFAAIILVAMTIRITVYARSDEIKVMKWVGATNAFIRWPFLVEGVLLGFMGALIAVALAVTLYYKGTGYAGEILSFIYFVDMADIWKYIIIYPLGAGILMGAVGSVISLARFLRV